MSDCWDKIFTFQKKLRIFIGNNSSTNEDNNIK
jgi:hypothetical protein